MWSLLPWEHLNLPEVVLANNQHDVTEVNACTRTHIIEAKLSDANALITYTCIYALLNACHGAFQSLKWLNNMVSLP